MIKICDQYKSNHKNEEDILLPRKCKSFNLNAQSDVFISVCLPCVYVCICPRDQKKVLKKVLVQWSTYPIWSRRSHSTLCTLMAFPHTKKQVLNNRITKSPWYVYFRLIKDVQQLNKGNSSFGVYTIKYHRYFLPWRKHSDSPKSMNDNKYNK